MRNRGYVVCNTQHGWTVQRVGKNRPESTHRKKDIAVRKGRSLAIRGKTTLKIKSKTGKIQATRNYTT